MTKLLKKNKLIEDNKAHYLYPDEITSIKAAVDKNGNAVLIVNYYDDDLCINSSIICEKIEVEDYIEYDSFDCNRLKV